MQLNLIKMTIRNPFCVLLFVVLCNITNYRDNKKCKLPCTNYRDHKNFYYKKTTQQIPANRKFLIHSNTNTFCPFQYKYILSIQMLYPAKIAKKSHSAKSKITYLTQFNIIANNPTLCQLSTHRIRQLYFSHNIKCIQRFF